MTHPDGGSGTGPGGGSGTGPKFRLRRALGEGLAVIARLFTGRPA